MSEVKLAHEERAKYKFLASGVYEFKELVEALPRLEVLMPFPRKFRRALAKRNAKLNQEIIEP